MLLIETCVKPVAIKRWMSALAQCQIHLLALVLGDLNAYSTLTSSPGLLQRKGYSDNSLIEHNGGAAAVYGVYGVMIDCLGDDILA